jgi:hypothetical protein
MSSANESHPDSGSQESQPNSGEQQHAGNSGEGAASALAHLKTQTKQHRRQIGDGEDAASSGGAGQ